MSNLDQQHYLIFGGIMESNNLLNRVMLFKEDVKDIRKSEIELVKYSLPFDDRIYFN